MRSGCKRTPKQGAQLPLPLLQLPQAHDGGGLALAIHHVGAVVLVGNLAGQNRWGAAG